MPVWSSRRGLQQPPPEEGKEADEARSLLQEEGLKLSISYDWVNYQYNLYGLLSSCWNLPEKSVGSQSTVNFSNFEGELIQNVNIEILFFPNNPSPCFCLSANMGLLHETPQTMFFPYKVLDFSHKKIWALTGGGRVHKDLIDCFCFHPNEISYRSKVIINYYYPTVNCFR